MGYHFWYVVGFTILCAVPASAQAPSIAQTPAIAQTPVHRASPWDATDKTLPLSQLPGLYLRQMAILPLPATGPQGQPLPKPQGHQWPELVAQVRIFNYTRYAFSSVSLKLQLYGTLPDGTSTVVATIPFTVTTIVPHPNPGAVGMVELPPGESVLANTASIDPDPYLHLLPGEDSDGGYWMKVVSVRATPVPISASQSPLEQLQQAVTEGDLVTAKAVGKAHPDLIRADRMATARGSLLGLAAMAHHPDLIAYLLAHGANVNGPPNTGQTPLMTAIDWISAPSVAILLAHHPDLSRRAYGRTALTLATQRADENGAGPEALSILQAVEHAQTAQRVSSAKKTSKAKTSRAKGGIRAAPSDSLK